MRTIRMPRLSPTLLVAVAALVAALAGTAIASDPVANTAVSKKKTKKIANKQIDKRLPWRTDDIGDQAVTEGKIQDGAVTDAKLSANALSNAIKVTKVNGPQLSVPTGESRSGNTTCPSGSVAISGEAFLDDDTDSHVNLGIASSRRDPGNARRWFIRVENGTTFTETWSIGAICISGVG